MERDVEKIAQVDRGTTTTTLEYRAASARPTCPSGRAAYADPRRFALDFDVATASWIPLVVLASSVLQVPVRFSWNWARLTTATR